MPDWRNKEDYSFTDELSLEGLAWEFLRRNPSYREAYKELQNNSQELDEIEDAYVYIPERIGGESFSDWNIRCIGEGVTPNKISLSVWTAQKWCIKGPMVDPCTDYDDDNGPRFISTPRFPKIVNLDECPDYFAGSSDFADVGYEQNLPYVLVGFNLSHSIKDQLEKLKENLSSLKERWYSENGNSRALNISNKKLMAKYLRVLDARDEQASAMDIGNCLFNGQGDRKARRDKAYRYIAAAESYRDNKFRHIPQRIKTPEK